MNDASRHGEWLVRFTSPAGCAVHLVCFPFGGGSAAYFARWAWRLDGLVDVIAIQYPGRCS
ncbi:thioesterase domain-containing protein, partial [Rhizobium sp. TRM95111]|uniref:thioesterase domain-containing protein n=1 Tax=Rhizobium alarense TaxID=2846851 RepID=UPI001F1AE559